eukprot:COSAG06_NODE_20811_length_780_cov_1.126285_1_plen_58_part_10
MTALADVELVSWEKIEDLSEDKKGGLLLKVRNATFCAIYAENASFYQDRLGTNIGKTQ